MSRTTNFGDSTGFELIVIRNGGVEFDMTLCVKDRSAASIEERIVLQKLDYSFDGIER